MTSRKHQPLLQSFTVLSLLLAIVLVGRSFAPDRVQITILGTTDLHGNINPIDYYTNKPDNRGLAKIATLINRVRKEQPNVVLVDSGDTIQGSPLESFHSRQNNVRTDPMMLVMNSLNYDAMAVGNHEYNFGLKVLEKARGEAKFPWLSGNTYQKGTERTYHKPYVVKDLAGVKIGIIGLTTPGVPYWDNPPNYAGLEFRDPVPEARKWVHALRTEEKVDVVVIAMHMGVEEDLRTGEQNTGQVPHENKAVAIAKEVPGVDVIFMGHTHREVPSLYINGVLLTQANHWGRHLARADLYLQRESSGWRVYAKSARTIPADDRVEPDPAVVKLAEPYDRQTQEWLDRVVAQSPEDLTAEEARFRDTAILDLVQKVQLEAGKADVSMVASFNQNARIAKGPVTVRDLTELYVYENTLAVLEITGQQLKDALEHSAKYYKTYEPGKSLRELIDDKIPAYNFDIAEGVTYDLDITKPIGSRIQNLRFKGQPLAPTRKLRLATNNYRVNGGGGYTMYKNAPVIFRSSEEIRELMVDWLDRNKTVPVTPNNNWRIVHP
ncbi:MAG TPA: 5'-nucleotidase C-terminal domain-containing protein [Pyrinomonadaceae bacterium]|nr:5'-nucleotidase C-terminal domain-containing protein [Pyrinomonadaceae bacterium]